MDKAALGMAMDYNLTTVIFDTMKLAIFLELFRVKLSAQKLVR